MITIIKKGDIFKSNCQTIVNTVNCVGVMGKGLALEFKNRYPQMFNEYKKICDNNLLTIGKLWIYKTDNKWILNFPTKIHWKNDSKYEYIEKGLDKFISTYKDKGITSIAFPILGCGNGNLNKGDIIELMSNKLSQCNIDVEIYV